MTYQKMCDLIDTTVCNYDKYDKHLIKCFLRDVARDYSGIRQFKKDLEFHLSFAEFLVNKVYRYLASDKKSKNASKALRNHEQQYRDELEQLSKNCIYTGRTKYMCALGTIQGLKDNGY